VLYNKKWFRRINTITYVDTISLYDLFQDGDILFSATYNNPVTLTNHLFSYFNNGITHNSFIVEEDGIKYIINGHMSINAAQEKRIMESHRGGKFIIFKEPLMEYLIQNRNNYIHQILRHPTQPLRFTKEELSWKNDYIYYCTQTGANALVRKGIIPRKPFSFSYRPDELIHELSKKGFHTYYVFQK
jgi:hypothetical protein